MTTLYNTCMCMYMCVFTIAYKNIYTYIYVYSYTRCVVMRGAISGKNELLLGAVLQTSIMETGRHELNV